MSGSARAVVSNGQARQHEIDLIADPLAHRVESVSVQAISQGERRIGGLSGLLEGRPGSAADVDGGVTGSDDLAQQHRELFVGAGDAPPAVD